MQEKILNELLKQGRKLFPKKDNIKTEELVSNLKEESLEKENNKIFFENKEKYKENHEIYISKMKPIYKFIDKHLPETDKFIYQKQMDQYEKYIEKNNEKIKLDKLDDEEYSESLTRMYLEIIERDFIKILDSIARGRKSNKASFYAELEKIMKNYLKSLYIYEKFIEIEEGKALPNEAYQYIKVISTVSKESELSGKVKEVERMPYETKFIDEDGIIKNYTIPGKVTVYK
ncbi:MAG: hypothetical protein ACRCZR_02185 [Cetobacterium sp.]